MNNFNKELALSLLGSGKEYPLILKTLGNGWDILANNLPKRS